MEINREQIQKDSIYFKNYYSDLIEEGREDLYLLRYNKLTEVEKNIFCLYIACHHNATRLSKFLMVNVKYVRNEINKIKNKLKNDLL